LNEHIEDELLPLFRGKEQAFLMHHSRLLIREVCPEDDRGEEHHEDALGVIPSHLIIDIIGNILMFVLLGSMPVPKITKLRMGVLHESAIVEKNLCEKGGEVFERRCRSKFPSIRERLLDAIEDSLDLFFELIRINSIAREESIVLLMLARMHGLLAVKAADVRLELRIGDLVLIAAHGTHEELLALGEEGREVI